MNKDELNQNKYGIEKASDKNELKPFNPPGKLPRPFIKMDEAADQFYPNMAFDRDGEEYISLRTPVAKRVKGPDGKESVLLTPFIPTFPADSVPENIRLQAELNSACYRIAYLENQFQAQTASIQELKEKLAAQQTAERQLKAYYTPSKVGLVFSKDDGKCELLCNYDLQPIAVVEVFARGEKVQEMIRFRVCLESDVHEMEIQADRIEDIAREIGRKIVSATVEPTVHKAEAKISKIFRDRLRDIPRERKQKVPGWLEDKNGHIFAHDAHATTQSGWIFETGKKILWSEKFAGQEIEIFKTVLGLADGDVIVPLVMTVLLGPLHAVLADVNPAFSPHYLLFLNGESGSLKTAVGKALATMYDADKPKVPASFRDTPASLEQRIKEFPYSPVLIDDFYATALGKEKKQMTSMLEMIIRYVGDNIGKNRSNGALEDIRAVRPTGTMIVTGEDTAGELSTLLRCLIINVDKKTFNRENLSKLQNEPLMWSSFLASFVAFLEEYYDWCVGEIRGTYEAIRRSFEPEFKELRLVDQLTQLVVACNICEVFLNHNHMVQAESIHFLMEQCRESCHQAVLQSQKYIALNSGENRYLRTLYRLLKDKKVKIAENREFYSELTGNFTGFKEGSFLYLRFKEVHHAVCRDLQRFGGKRVLSELEAKRVLKAQNLIETEIEKSTGKENLEKKVKIGNERPRMLKLNLKLLEAYFEEEFA